MNARPPCLASQDADAYAHQQGEYDAEDAALYAYTREHYGPPWAPEFVQEALQAAQYKLAKQISAASERMGQSLNPEHPQLTVIGNSMDEWLRDFATQCARRDMQEARNAA